MKKLSDVAHEKLNNIIGRHGILDQYLRMDLWMTIYLCSKSAQKRQLLLGTVPENNFSSLFL